MRILIYVLVVLVCTGCMTTYEIVKETPDGNVSVLVKSFREFQQPDVSYTRNGDDVTFTFGAESATTAVSPIEAAAADVIRAGGSIGASIPDG